MTDEEESKLREEKRALHREFQGVQFEAEHARFAGR